MKALLIILSIIWILGGTFFSKSTLCGKSSGVAKSAAVGAAGAAAAGGCDGTLSIKAGEFNVKSKNNFKFKGGDIELLNPKEINADALNKIKDYLSENASSSLVIEGNYSQKETNDTGKDNIGIARALVVKDFLVGTYKFNADQLKIGSVPGKTCFNNKTNTLQNGAKLSVTTK